MAMENKPATFVLVHGAWSGGWCYARVATLLRARGHTVFTPTLTGQGERAHLMSGAINLSTHIEDVLGVFRFERLSRSNRNTPSTSSMWVERLIAPLMRCARSPWPVSVGVNT